MKPLYKKVFLWILLVLHITLIFSFSMQSAEESTIISRGITENVKTPEQFEKKIRNEELSESVSEKEIKRLAERDFLKLEGVFRKLAHISLFFILGTLINFLIRTYGMKRLFCAVVSLVFAMSVAFVDETIQLFSIGRAGSLSDVFIDLSGAAIASAFFYAGGKLYEKNKKKRFKMDS